MIQLCMWVELALPVKAALQVADVLYPINQTLSSCAVVPQVELAPPEDGQPANMQQLLTEATLDIGQ